MCATSSSSYSCTVNADNDDDCQYDGIDVTLGLKMTVPLQILADYLGDDGSDTDPVVRVLVDMSGASPLVPLSAQLPAAAVLSPESSS